MGLCNMSHIIVRRQPTAAGTIAWLFIGSMVLANREIGPKANIWSSQMAATAPRLWFKT